MIKLKYSLRPAPNVYILFSEWVSEDKIKRFGTKEKKNIKKVQIEKNIIFCNLTQEEEEEIKHLLWEWKNKGKFCVNTDNCFVREKIRKIEKLDFLTGK